MMETVIHDKRALVILAHGSRNPNVPLEIEKLVETASEQLLPVGFSTVRKAFLELIDPKLPHVCQQLVEESYTRIVVAPYFLARGNHVEKDVPTILEALRQTHSGVRFDQLDYFGANTQIALWLQQHVLEQMGESN